MILAAKTTATTTEVWAIVIVAVVCLAFWLVMVVAIAPRPRPDPARRRSSRWLPLSTGAEETMTPLGELGPVVGGSHLAYGGRSVAPRRDAPAMAIAGEWGDGGQGQGQRPEAEPEAPAAGTEVTRDDTPAVTVPGQRTSVPLGAATSAAQPAGGGTDPGVPGQRESATDQPARSRPSDRDQGRDRDQ